MEIQKEEINMFLTKTVAVIVGKAITYVDALSIIAASLIVLFLVYIFIRQNMKNKK